MVLCSRRPGAMQAAEDVSGETHRPSRSDSCEPTIRESKPGCQIENRQIFANRPSPWALAVLAKPQHFCDQVQPGLEVAAKRAERKLKPLGCLFLTRIGLDVGMEECRVKPAAAGRGA